MGTSALREVGLLIGLCFIESNVDITVELLVIYTRADDEIEVIFSSDEPIIKITSICIFESSICSPVKTRKKIFQNQIKNETTYNRMKNFAPLLQLFAASFFSTLSAYQSSYMIYYTYRVYIISLYIISSRKRIYQTVLRFF